MLLHDANDIQPTTTTDGAAALASWFDGRPYFHSWSQGALPPCATPARSVETKKARSVPVYDSALAQVVRRELYTYAIPWQDSDTMHAHASCEVPTYLKTVLEFDTERRRRQKFTDDTIDRDEILTRALFFGA